MTIFSHTQLLFILAHSFYCLSVSPEWSTCVIAVADVVDVVCCVWAFHSDTLLPDDLVSSGIIDAACRDEVDESEFESFDRLFSQLPVMKGELLEFICKRMSLVQ